MNFDIIIGLAIYVWQKANENTLVIVPLVVVFFYLNIKLKKTWAYQTEKYLDGLNGLVDASMVTNEEYQKRVSANMLRYTAEVLDALRVIVGLLIGIFVYLVLYALN